MKKRNKSYKARPVGIPTLVMVRMVLDEKPYLQGTLHGQLLAFIERPNAATCNNLNEQITVIAAGLSMMIPGRLAESRDPAVVGVRSAALCLEGIWNRLQSTGAIQVLEREAMTLRAASVALDEVLTRMPLTVYEAGEKIARTLMAQAAKAMAESESQAEAA
jgi:hypothetical protein